MSTKPIFRSGFTVSLLHCDTDEATHLPLSENQFFDQVSNVSNSYIFRHTLPHPVGVPLGVSQLTVQLHHWSVLVLHDTVSVSLVSPTWTGHMATITTNEDAEITGVSLNMTDYISSRSNLSGRVAQRRLPACTVIKTPL